MDPHGHESISEAARELLREALKDLDGYAFDTQKECLGAFYFGNWCTDMTQLWDEVTGSKVHGLARAAVRDIDHIFEQLFKYLEVKVKEVDYGRQTSGGLNRAIDKVCQQDDSAALVRWVCERGGDFARKVAELPEAGENWARARIEAEIRELEKGVQEVRTLAMLKLRMLFGPPGGIGQVAQGIRHLLRVAAFIKFCGPGGGRLDFKSFKAIFDQFLPPITLDAKGDPKPAETNQWGPGFRGAYYPHHHIDRWPEQVTYPGTDNLRNHSPKSSTNPSSINPGLYPFMRDCLEYSAGLLADLELTWAEPTFSAYYQGQYKTRPNGVVDRDWMVQNDLRLAQLGHALHVVEDFFAHSTFLEHALRVTDDAKAEASMKRHFEWALKTTNKLTGSDDDASATRAAEWMAGKIPDRDFTRFQRRTLKLQVSWLSDPHRNQLMNQTSSDRLKLEEEPNVVTGIFDLRDTVISVKHVVMDKAVYPLISRMVNHLAEGVGVKLDYEAAHGDSINKAARTAGDWREDPVKELFKFKSEKEQAFSKWWQEITIDIQELKNVLSGDIKPFDVDQKVAEEIAGPFLPEWAREKDGKVKGEYKEIEKDLVAAMSLLNSGLRWKDHVVTIVDSLEWVVAFFEGPAAVKKLIVDLLGKTLIGKGLNFYLQLGDDAVNDLIGANRIGCHSLIAKDHDYDYLADDALNLAKALDYYIVENLLRWRRKYTKVVASKAAFKGPPPPKSQGKNVFVQDMKYIDWLELLEYFLRHPGGAASQATVTRPVTLVHITKDGDRLDSLAELYRPTAVHPDTFNWQKLALVNYGIDASHSRESEAGQRERRAINRMLAQSGDGLPLHDHGNNYYWKRDVRVLIPDQKWTDHVRVKGDFKKTWYFRVLDFDWTVIKDGWFDKDSGFKIKPIHDHLPRMIDRPDLEALISGSQKVAGDGVAAYQKKGRMEYSKALWGG